MRRYLFILALLFPLMLMARPASAKTWYVSYAQGWPAGRDGQSWSTAWTDFSDYGKNYLGQTPAGIDWSKIKPGDKIEIDAGPAGTAVYFRTPIKVGARGQYGLPITIEVSKTPGRDGGIVVVPGIEVGKQRQIIVRGTKWLPGTDGKAPNLRVFGPTLNSGPEPNPTMGVKLDPDCAWVTLENLYVAKFKYGMVLRGGQVYCNFMRVEDNDINVLYAPTNAYMFPNVHVNESWISGNFKKDGIGVLIQGDPPESGAFQNGTFIPVRASFNLRKCVVGPGLTHSVYYDSTTIDALIRENLMINPKNNQFVAARLPAGNASITMNKNCLFETQLNALNQPRVNLNFAATNRVFVNDSIVYGGVVNVGGSTRLGQGDFQFRTTGNTVVLSAGQVDPMFVSDPGAVPNTASVLTLRNLNFALKPESPVQVLRDNTVYPSSISSFMLKLPSRNYGLNFPD